MQIALDLHFLVLSFFSQLTQSESWDLLAEYDSECTLIPRRMFKFTGSDKKVQGRELGRVFTAPNAVGKCMNLCSQHKNCNAVNYKKSHDSENCVLIQTGRIAETETASGWLGYTSDFVCMPGCYRNAGMCLFQTSVTEVSSTKDYVTIRNLEFIDNKKLDLEEFWNLPRIESQKANHLIWIRLSLAKITRVARVILYISNGNDKYSFTNPQDISVKVGNSEQERTEEVEKARYCAYNVRHYPGETKGKPHFMTRKDVYCYGPLEGRFVYVSKYTTRDSWEDMIALREVVVFGEKA